MADPQKRNRSPVNVKEKDPLQDLEIGNDFFSWKPISMAEGDVLDFDLTPVSKGNKKTFNFDKADMDFNLDADFGKISSFNLDMSDLDMSPPLKKEAKSKEKSKESSSGKDKGKTDHFAFGFDFDELENFSFDSGSTKESTKAQRDKKNKQNSLNGSGCQDKEDFIHINETGSKSTLKDTPQEPSLTETQITFDMDCLVGVADLEPTRKNCPSNSAMNDSVTPEHSTAIDAGESDKAKSPPKTIPNISPSKRLVSPGQVDLEAYTKNEVMPDLPFDYVSNNEPSGSNSSAAEKKVDSMDTNASGSSGEQNANMPLVTGSTCNYEHPISKNSQHLQDVAVSEIIDELSGDNLSAADNKVSCMDANVSGSNGEQDANMILIAGSTFNYEDTSKNSQQLQAAVISENINGERTQDGAEGRVEDDKGRTELGQTNSNVENSCMTGAVPGIPCDTQSSREDQEPAFDILKSSFVSQPADPLEKQTENIKDPHINCSGPLIQSEKPECPVLKASTQTVFSSLSSKHMGFSQPSLVEGRDRDATRSDRKLASLSLQCSKTLLRGKIPQIQSQKSCNGLKIYGEAPIADGLQNRNKLNDSSTSQLQDMMETKSALRQREMCTKDLDTLSMETNRKAAENSGNPKKLAYVPSNKNTPVQEHRASSIEGGRKPPGLPGLKLSRLSIDSTKSPIWRESKSVGNSSQKSSLLSKSPSSITHLPDNWKQTTSTLPMKRTLEEDTADTIALYPSKRLSQLAPTSRNFVETSEKVLDKKAPSHNHMEDNHIRSTTGNCQVMSFDILHEVETKGVEILSSTKNDSNIKLADACSKELDDLCDILRKKHDEAKELLVQAIVNSNKLLMLNNPQFEEKISFKLSTFYSLYGFDFHNSCKSTLF
ncbi:hypothetical protein C2S52_010728 [Perilla frutescens var. hirtella]|nr:hypothetical protein C2S52_010728 [Perilla frutescens var. hirtella]